MAPRFPLTDVTALDLGAGVAQQLPGAVRLDRTAACGPHVIADLDRGALPFRSASFALVGAFDVVEHVADLVALMEEIHRVLRPGGVVRITTPHFSSANAYTDPTHRRSLGMRSFLYFLDGHPLAYYSRARFQLRARSLMFRGRMLGRLMARLARRWPELYEDRLAWMFPAWFMYVELEAVK
jgi:SAM-dependent methyltransferase